MRLSRWGRSPYETDADIRLESEALARMVTLVPERADAEIVVVHSKIPMGPTQHGQAPSLRMILTTTSGTDHIDLDHFEERGIVVGRLAEARRDAVVDATIAKLIWGLRRLGPLQQAAARGEWARPDLPALAPIGLRGARVGLVGLGVIGRCVATVLAALGCEVWGSDPAGLPEGVQAASVEEMLGHCDAISLHCDLNDSTVGLLGSTRLPLCHPDLVIVNTARGDLVDVKIALSMLDEDRLGALALDVFPAEPWDTMAQSDGRVMFTPHAAGFHTDLSKKIRDGLCSAVTAFLNQQPIPHRVYPG